MKTSKNGSTNKVMKFEKPVKKKKEKRKKSKTITLLKKELLSIVKAEVKKRDNNTCQKCGKEVEGSNCQASHVIPVSHGNCLMFDPLNMKVLCMHCHLHWWHKNPLEAHNWFREKFPERYEYLMSNKNKIVKWKEADYIEMIQDMTLP